MSYLFSHLKQRRQRGYTLIEMLVSVAIFSGLLIIVLGTIATSSSSSARVSLLRDKNQTARNLIDQVTGDLRYVDTKIVFTDGGQSYSGYLVSSNRLVMALHLPNTSDTTELVRKEYGIKIFANRLTLTLQESRGCDTSLQNCALQSPETDLLPSTYILNQESTVFPSQFDGLDLAAASANVPPLSPFVSVTFTIKPTDFKAQTCSDISLQNPGTCYKVSTTINIGAST